MNKIIAILEDAKGFCKDDTALSMIDQAIDDLRKPLAYARGCWYSQDVLGFDIRWYGNDIRLTDERLDCGRAIPVDVIILPAEEEP